MSLDYFFADTDSGQPEIEVTEPLRYGIQIKNAFTLDELQYYTRQLHGLPWRIQEIEVAGKSYLPKRETLGFADPGHEGYLLNRSFYGCLYDTTLAEIKDQVRDIVSTHVRELETPEMNFCWGNRYRTGQDKVGKHKDNEKYHSPIDPIISVSFGESRFFDVHSEAKRIYRTSLGWGDIFLMLPGFQQAYYHSVPVQKKVHGSRINLTYRTLVEPPL
ncbi:MAG: alpha-ketoglutarate-dependent dioxygenase AlkB [Candidatus Kariarchaeaceae archaeon]